MSAVGREPTRVSGSTVTEYPSTVKDSERTSEVRARVTPRSYVIGFPPGLMASVLGTMFAGIGVYRRQTSQLFKELEV